MAPTRDAGYTACPVASLVAHDRLLCLHGAAVLAGLDRDALLTGIDRRLVASFHRASSVTAQLLVDLGELNRVKHRVDGDLPLRIWLQNAVAMLGPRREASMFIDALGLQLRSKKKPFCFNLETEGLPRMPHGSRSPRDKALRHA